MLDFLATLNNEGSYDLKTASYIIFAFAIFLLLMLAAMVRSKNRKISTRQLAFCSVAIAAAFITSCLKLFHMPMGGSITVFSMLIITLIGFWYGPVVGIITGVAYGILQMLVDPYIVSIPQAIVDYLLSFGALGISGFFARQKNGLVIGYITGVLGRFFFAVLSGVIFFGMYAPETMSPFVYSVLYNGGYLGGEALLTMVLLFIPAVRRALDEVKRYAAG